MERGLITLYDEAAGPADGVALAAVGSLARRELGPRSDLDLVLVHAGTAGRGGTASEDVQTLAERLWYPLWDARVRLDHAVRTPAQCVAVAGEELSAGIGLLDLRFIAGDAELVSATRSRLLAEWRNGARRRLPELLASIEERRAAFGDAAYLLEPDLKEARGGLRDVAMLRALAATWLTDQPHTQVSAAAAFLLDVRDALQLSSGRPTDRLLVGEIADVADRLGHADPDAVRREVSLSARRIGHAVDLTARAARQVVPVRRVISFARRERKPDYRSGPHGLIVHQGEVGLGADADRYDPLLGLRAGAYAAREGLVLSPVTAENLGAVVVRMPTPWPAEALDSLLRLLSSGAALVPVWEALELTGCIETWLPEWRTIVAQPQHNPIHRHTVDRHSVQTVVECAPFLTDVERPDLLLLAALFHDIGKGIDGPEHAELGAPIARQTVIDFGLAEPDADLVELLVAQHLILPELATRRDPTDPKTTQALTAAVAHRPETLRLLRRLTEADARAAGPAAWSPWRAQLIGALTDRVLSGMTGAGRPEPDQQVRGSALAALVRGDGRPRIEGVPVTGGVELTIAETDRIGLFSDTAGLLAAHQITVRSGMLTTRGDVAVNTWRIEAEHPDDLPDLAYLVQQLERLADHDTQVLTGLRRREARSRRQAPEPFVQLLTDASSSAVVIEIRAGDRGGLLWALGAAVAELDLSIRFAQLSTLAGQAIDTFYLTEPDGSVPSGERARQAVEALAGAAAPEASRVD